MKNVLRSLGIILGGLFLVSYSPPSEKRPLNPKDKDVFIVGKVSFKKEISPMIKFWIEGDKGIYSVVIYGGKNDEQLKELVDKVNILFEMNISSSLNHYVLNYEKVNYYIINFNNKKINGLRGIKLIPLGFRIVHEIERHTGGNISGHVVW